MRQNHVFKWFWDDLEAGIGISIQNKLAGSDHFFDGFFENRDFWVSEIWEFNSVHHQFWPAVKAKIVTHDHTALHPCAHKDTVVLLQYPAVPQESLSGGLYFPGVSPRLGWTGWLVGWFRTLDSLHVCALANYVTELSNESPGWHKRWALKSSTDADGSSGLQDIISIVCCKMLSIESIRFNVAASALVRIMCRYLDLSLGSLLSLPSVASLSA